MSAVLPISDIIQIGRATTWLSANYSSKKTLFGGSLSKPVPPVQIAFITDALDWGYDGGAQTDQSLRSTANYAMWCYGVFSLQAQAIISGTGGGTVIPFSPLGSGVDWIMFNGGQLSGNTYTNPSIDGKVIRVFDTSIPNYLKETTQYTHVGDTLTILTGGIYTSADIFYVDIKGSSSGTGGGGDCCATLLLNLENYEGDTDLDYPLGVFSVAGTYLGIANNTEEYTALWNADTGNAALGEIIAGIGTQFEVQPIYINTVINLYALEYWTAVVNFANDTAIRLHCDTGDYVQYGSTVIDAGTAGTLTNSDTKREYNQSVVSATGYWKVDQFNFRYVTCTGAASGSSIRIFHSRSSRYCGVNLFNALVSISGILPTSCYSFYARTLRTTNLATGMNWSSLTALKWFRIENIGGNPYFIDSVANIPQLPSNVVGISLSDVNLSPSTGMQGFTWLIAANYPNIRQFYFGANGIPLTSLSESWFATMPQTTEVLQFIFSAGVGTPTQTDNIIIAINAAMPLLIPIGQKKIRLDGANNRTAASNTAYNNLVTNGWTIQLP